MERAILGKLTTGELRTSVDVYGLAIRDRRVKKQLVEALATSRKARVDKILGALSRTRLRELCRAFDLDDSGRKKADLVARLLESTRATKRNGRYRASSGASPVKDRSGPSIERLSVTQLEAYLWSAADILRGSIDSSDYKTYIFGLLFLKSLLQNSNWRATSESRT